LVIGIGTKFGSVDVEYLTEEEAHRFAVKHRFMIVQISDLDLEKMQEMTRRLVLNIVQNYPENLVQAPKPDTRKHDH